MIRWKDWHPRYLQLNNRRMRLRNGGHSLRARTPFAFVDAHERSPRLS